MVPELVRGRDPVQRLVDVRDREHRRRIVEVVAYARVKVVPVPCRSRREDVEYRPKGQGLGGEPLSYSYVEITNEDTHELHPWGQAGYATAGLMIASTGRPVPVLETVASQWSR